MSGVALGLGYYFDVPFWGKTHLTPSSVAIGAMAGLAMVFLAIFLVKCPIGPLQQLTKDFEKVAGLFNESSVFNIALISLAAGISEEFLFRGFLEPIARGHIGPVGTALIIAALFGGIHYLSMMYVFFIAFASIVLSLLYLWTGNLVTPIVAHFCYDAFGILCATRSGMLRVEDR